MEIHCPDCRTLNAVSQVQLADPDEIITCISCGAHFTARGTAAQRTIDEPDDDDLTGVDIDAIESRSRSVRIPLDQVDWRSVDRSVGRAASARRAGQRPSAVLHSATPTPTGTDASSASDISRLTEDDRYTWRDLPQAFLSVFHRERFLFALLSLWGALVCAGALQWSADWVANRNAGLATLFDLLAVLIFTVLYILVSSVCSVLCHSHLIEGRTASIKDAIHWTQNWVQSVVGTPLSFMAVVASAVILEALFGFIGRIPVAGPVLWGILSAITVVGSLLSGLAVVCLVYSLPVYIPLIYNERTSPIDTLNRLLELFKTSGGRILASSIGLSALVAGVGVLVILPVWLISGQLTGRVAGATMGSDLTSLLAEVPAPFFVGISNILAGTPAASFALEPSVSHTIGGVLAGLFFMLGPAFVLALWTLIMTAGGCLIYAMVTGRRKEQSL